MTGVGYLLALAPQWSLTLSLIFGGCCANAFYLEEATRQQPSCGTLLTFLHFTFTTLQTLPAQLEWPQGSVLPRLRTPAVPVRRWLVQVFLYFASSLLNNSAFAFHVPVPVHIIFRSGGLVVNMALGWLVHRRRYSLLQIVSVIVVTAGVIVATLATTPSSDTDSASSSEKHSSKDDEGVVTAANVSSLTYFSGIGLLVLALILSSLMGLYQEATFAKYGSEHWRESLFYNHFLSLPLFAIRRGTLASEWAEATAGPRTQVGLSTLLYSHPSAGSSSPSWMDKLSLNVPSLFPSLLANVLTQLLCINGVNRLTAHVSSLTVTLVLVVRKAVSLAISVLIVAPARGEEQKDGVGMLAVGAAAVCIGTVGYAVGAGQQPKQKKPVEGEKNGKLEEKASIHAANGKGQNSESPAAAAATRREGSSTALKDSSSRLRSTKQQ